MCNEICPKNGDLEKEIDSESKAIMKDSDRYREAEKRFMSLFRLSIIILLIGLIIGLISDIILDDIIFKSIGRSFNTLFMFMAGITAGLTIDQYKNKSNIEVEACTLRPQVLLKKLNSCERKGKLTPSDASRCKTYIENGSSAMCIAGPTGDSALTDVIKNIQTVVCNKPKISIGEFSEKNSSK